MDFLESLGDGVALLHGVQYDLLHSRGDDVAMAVVIAVGDVPTSDTGKE